MREVTESADKDFKIGIICVQEFKAKHEHNEER